MPIRGKKPLTTEAFIERSNKAHNNKYDYSLVVYTKAHDFIKVICPNHGVFEQEANHHMRGRGCRKCSTEISTANRVRTKEEFSFLAGEVHKHKYNYEQVVYVRDSVKVDILCTIHGVFKMTPNSHLQGQSCPTCSQLDRIESLAKNPSGWRVSTWLKASSSSKYFESFKVYFIKLFNDDECFYKIGRTYRKIKRRFWDFPYENEVLLVVTHENAEIIFNLENHLKRTFKNYKYKPLQPFHGQHECFAFTPDLIESVLREMEITLTSDNITTSS